jgi:hypothetical protein
VSEVRDIVRQTAGLVASELGEGWSVDVSPDTAENNATLVGPDGARVFMHLPMYGNTDKFEITGWYGWQEIRDMYPDPERVSINVGRFRGPEVIAREISRRLLPKYLPELVRVNAWKAKRRTAEAVRDEVAAELFAAAGDTPGPHAQHTVYVKNAARNGGITRMTVELGGSVSVERMYLTVDQARRLIALLSEG